MSCNSWNFKTARALSTGLLVFLCMSVPTQGQGGTGREPAKPRPKKATTTSTKKTTAKKTSSANTRTNPITSAPVFRPQNPKIELVQIQPGSFMMGSNGIIDPDPTISPSSRVSENEKPVHQVTIKYSFYLGKYEVTQAQWQAVMGNNPSAFENCGGNCPVENVSWYDAQEFIKTLNSLGDGFKYRLPTEAEWEYACRAGTTGDYAGDLNAMAWYKSNAGMKTHAVGQKQPNAWGLADMHGNVEEWCEDPHHWDYEDAPTDGSAWSQDAFFEHVVRGGSIFDDALSLRSAKRYWHRPFWAVFFTGLRVVAVR